MGYYKLQTKSLATVIKKPRLSYRGLRFSKVDEWKVLDAEANYPLIVSITISFFQINRILVDTKSSVDILMTKTFHMMGFKDTTLMISS